MTSPLNKRFFQPLLLLLIVSIVSTCDIGLAQEIKISFNRDIRPILSDKCFHCHGPDESGREADLRFDIKADAFHVIEAGDPDSSDLMARILSDDSDLKMPPAEVNKPLKPEEIELLRKWIEQGAPWSEFWAYTAPVNYSIPKSNHFGPKSNWIDQMVSSRLEARQMKISDPADSVTLIRRVYFDLIGLPPTPEQVNDFLADDSPDAFSNVVDDLLASPHFGERMAIYWLDLVRYADTVGYHGDQDHNISPYRDWVINAFNDNMPFDQFTIEQLAGDLLPDSTESQQIASGYNRLLQTTHEGGLQAKEYSAIYAADRVRNVSGVWMGATVGCSQCHDHKYDPYSAKDFYSLSAFFADIDDQRHFTEGSNALPTRRPPEILLLPEPDRKQLALVRAEIAKITSTIRASKKSLASFESKAKKSSNETRQDSDSPLAGRIAKLKTEIKTTATTLKKLRGSATRIERRGRWTMVTQALKSPRITRILPRGNWLDESGPVVDPAVPEFLGTLDFSGDRATRHDLATWLTDGDQLSGQLTARVMANRIWYLLMGVGISRSLDDFGGQGEPPRFPELLDNLAIELIAKDWDLKSLIRQIAMSQTYRQSSVGSDELRKLDPYNQLFARQSRYRLPAEIVRDNILAISGLLVCDEVGGKSIRPYQPKGYYQHLNFPVRKYAHDRNTNQWRRGVYIHWQRQFLHPTLKALDAPSREECTALRAVSNTPSAALALLNDPSFVEASRVFAARVLHEAKTDDFESRLTRAFELALSRRPSPDERTVLEQLFQSNLANFRLDPESAKSLISIGQSPVSTQFDTIKLASWTMLVRAILNTNESMTRN